MSGFESSITEPIKQNAIKMLCCSSKVFRAKCFKSQGNAEGNTMTERAVLAGNDNVTAAGLLSDQRGAASLEMTIVSLFMMLGLLVPLADVAVAGFKFNSAYQALRDMGQLTQYSNPDATDPTSISTWQSSLPTTVAGYTVTAAVKCGDAGAAAPCAGTTWPKYFLFSTSFTLSPMVLGSVLCSTCTVNYSQRFQ
jgi:Flp pilus assembly protein TadG